MLKDLSTEAAVFVKDSRCDHLVSKSTDQLARLFTNG
jgi:hypothetical protein